VIDCLMKRGTRTARRLCSASCLDAWRKCQPGSALSLGCLLRNARRLRTPWFRWKVTCCGWQCSRRRIGCGCPCAAPNVAGAMGQP